MGYTLTEPDICKENLNTLKMGSCPFCDGTCAASDRDKSKDVNENDEDLTANILANSNMTNIKEHPWYVETKTLAAHHLLPKESCKSGALKRIIERANWNINEAANGVMLPGNMDVACQVRAPLHRGNHGYTKCSYSKDVARTDSEVSDAAINDSHNASATMNEGSGAGSRGDEGSSADRYNPKGDDVDLNYPSRVRNAFLEGFECAMFDDNAYCKADGPAKLKGDIEWYVYEIVLKKVGAFIWTLTSDGKNYRDHKAAIGCGGLTKVNKDNTEDCNASPKRDHKLEWFPWDKKVRVFGDEGVPLEPRDLEIGK